ncbi:PorP/SprF family type IX secretion system membrane protein [Pedobacter sp. SYSU D00535]|uniref:PorP/SprF family type IX secretion system membrane protein n=1 Tax=Pedobacter sp. SYSU D00535 TaxID=2810308 RepID=UPI001A965896|nr:PorP/SprF family type IX secretion system membrane protein [Pedobacter sp. SYSU D00535]
MKTLNTIQKLISKAGSLSLLLLAGLTANEANAQLNPLGATYYQNPYILNPAMAGTEQGVQLDLAARQQWSVLPGAPKTQSITAVYGSGKKTGLGLNLYNDEAGLIKNTRVSASYAYHLPLNSEGQHLSFGVSLGLMYERIMNDQMDGDQNDLSVSRFQQRETFLDGDFGAAYVGSRLTAQFALPNLKSFFQQEEAQGSQLVDRSGYFASLSYKFSFPNAVDGLGLEPTFRYRDIKGLDNIMDIGTNITLAKEQVNVLMLYHTTQSMSVGMGVKATPAIRIHGMYTSGTADLAGNTNGNFELNLKLNLSKLKK